MREIPNGNDRRPQGTCLLPFGLVLVTWAVACGDQGPGVAASAGDQGGPLGDVAAPASAVTSAPIIAPPRVQQGPTVAFLGDSISAGLHLPGDQAFPAVLARKLSQAGAPFKLVNAGVSGDTSAGGLRRVDWLLKQGPAVVVVELGGNDGLRGQPVQQVESNLRAIIDRVRKAGATPVLLGMRLPPSYGAQYAESFDELYPRLAQELDVVFVPFFMEGVAGVPGLNLPDGMHPTAQGHVKLAERVQPALEQVLRGLKSGG